MDNLYEFLEVDIAAPREEIEMKIEDIFNYWRGVASNHHDPEVRSEADKKLRVCEKARELLLDDVSRANYDASLVANVGGLGDASAQPASPPQRVLTPPSGKPLTTPVQESLSPWQCPNCRTQNVARTRFCKACGFELSSKCPNCQAVIDYQTSFCPECGVDVEAYREELEVKIQLAEKEQRERDAQYQLLAPLQQKADDAYGVSRTGCFLYFIPFVSLVSPVLWLIGAMNAAKVLNAGQVPGDTDIRARAKSARKLSTIGLSLFAISCVFLLIFFVNN